MTRPTHIDPDGNLCFPEGVQGAVPIPAGLWASKELEQATEALRAKRNALLALSDWTQLPDVSRQVKTLWQPYRQALRDLPENTKNPLKPDWPQAPDNKGE